MYVSCILVKKVNVDIVLRMIMVLSVLGWRVIVFVIYFEMVYGKSIFMWKSIMWEGFLWMEGWVFGCLFIIFLIFVYIGNFLK